MKIELFFVGKTSEKFIEDGVVLHLKRLVHYVPVTVKIIPSAPSGSKDSVVKNETDSLMSKITNRDFVVMLEERGKELTSVQFADFFQKQMVGGTFRIIFIVGGAYGVSETILKRANLVLSFSKFTFTHQMIRLFLAEQIYRAMTIIRNEQYHH